MSNREPLNEIQQRQYAGLVLLDRLCTNPKAFHAALLEQEDDHLLDDTFKFLLSEGVVDIGDDDFYQPTPAGQKAYEVMIHQRQSYLVHFEIYAGVDLAEGVFADQTRDHLGDPRWSDLRVGVAEYKGIDPYRVVFLALLAEEKFFANSDWKFDLALGSTFFRELEEIVASQISVEELGYVAEDGVGVSGDAVIEDVIFQAATINRARMEQEENRQQSLLAEDFPEGTGNGDGPAEVTLWHAAPYDPWQALAGYVESPFFVEQLWLDPYW